MALTLEELDESAIARTRVEIAAARQKHGLSIEGAGHDRRLRWMVEEVGEISRALDDLDTARDLVYGLEDAGAPADEVEAARSVERAAELHLREEIAQVGACAIRWISAELLSELSDRSR
jgi:NTP pyrophosphatase (non-canonical NTP hydrolase)